MPINPLLPLMLLAAPVSLQAQQSGAGQAADRFSIDLPVDTSVAAPQPGTAAPAGDAPAGSNGAAATTSAEAAASASARTGLRVSYTLDTPIRDLIGNPAAKAVLDRDLPGLSDDDNLPKFAALGLRQFQPLTGGQLTDAMLAKVARDLAAVGGTTLAPPPAASPATTRRRRDESR